MTRSTYLHHNSGVGEFWLSSDSIIPTFDGWLTMEPIIKQLQPEEVETFTAAGCTVGGTMIFPGNRVNGKQMINVARASSGASPTGWTSHSSASGGTTWAGPARSLRH